LPTFRKFAVVILSAAKDLLFPRARKQKTDKWDAAHIPKLLTPVAADRAPPLVEGRFPRLWTPST
jgi:hypothetical protein